MKKVRALMVGLAMSVAMQVCAADALTEALQKGLFEEEANQNLEAAIKAYQDVLGRADEQRRVAATALFRLAECYRKQGKTNEATAEYRRLVRDYSEQATLVNLSRQNLMGLGVGTTGAPVTAAQNTDPLTTDEEQQEIQRIRNLIKNSPDLINAKNRTFTPVGSGPVTGTVLHEAAFKGHLLVAEYLLANGSDVNALDTHQSTPLYHAARSGHKRVVELLLAKGAKPSLGTYLPLHAVAERGFIGVAEVLLASKADVNAIGQGRTALHVAIEHKNLPIAELLLAKGANVNALYARSWNQGQGALHSLGTFDGSPLHFAVQSGNPSLARALLAKGADANARTTHAGLTPLHYAQNSNFEPDVAKSLVEILLEAGAKIDAPGTDGGQLSGWTPLHLAVYHKLPQLAQLLLEKGADPNLPLTIQSGNERTALNMAVSAGAIEIAELLLKHRADVNARDHNGDTPLVRAMREGNHRIVELLLANKADLATVNTEGNTALALAVHADNLPMAELLLSKGANANDTNFSGFPLLHVSLGARPPGATGQPFPLPSIPLPQPQVFVPGARPQPMRIGGPPPGKPSAERKSDKTMLQLLLEHKADPNQRDQVRDKESETALHLAARNGNQAAVELLLKHKANPNARADSGTTPLHWAVQTREEGMVDLLLAHDADVKAAKNDGDTALHSAAAQGLTNHVAKLLQRGADINACGGNGGTPLHRTIRASTASSEHQLAAVDFLLKAGADMLKRCDDRLSAFEEAVLREKHDPTGKLVAFFRKQHPKKLAAATFDGAVVRPVWFWEADKPPTLSEAIATVGLKDTADPARITIMRNDPDTGMRGDRYNLVAIREKFPGAQDVPLKNGDKIIVPVRAD